MENYHKDTKHTKANDEGNLVLLCLAPLLSIFVPSCLGGEFVRAL
jgi:hypothetical protein